LCPAGPAAEFPVFDELRENGIRNSPPPPIAARSRLREFSDAEAIVLMYRDKPS
jgi:hypothetical protein